MVAKLTVFISNIKPFLFFFQLIQKALDGGDFGDWYFFFSFAEKVKFIFVFCGKLKNAPLQALINDYLLRVSRYADVEIIDLPEIKNQGSQLQMMEREAQVLEKNLLTGDFLVALDEKGKMLTSNEFSAWTQQTIMRGNKRCVFFAGGPYGIHDRIKSRADYMLSLSKMTFTHDMVRLFVIEQFYRAFAIINNLPYHHDS